MRIKRLDLTRYGRFTDQSFDFGDAQQKVPDLHIVYGENEAGKSTAFSGYLDLLFGIDAKSAYAFLHPYATMRLGACLQSKDGDFDLTRIKRPKNSLLNRAEENVSELVIQNLLSGLDRPAYQTMFSLNEETLKAGGETILASKGDLGQLLFSASAGLAELGQILSELRERTDEFFRPKSAKASLNLLKKQLSDLKEERERFDTLASAYAHLQNERDKADAAYRAAHSACVNLQIRQDDITRLTNAWPRLDAWRRIEHNLAALPTSLPAPESWFAAIGPMQQRDIRLSVESDAIDRQIAGKTAELESLVLDPAMLAIGEKLARLSEPRARYQTAEKDLPDRIFKLRLADAAIDACLRKLGKADEKDPQRLLLKAADVSQLRDLVEARSGIITRLDLAKTAFEEAERRLTEANKPLLDGAAEPAQIMSATAAQRLADNVAKFRQENFSENLRIATRAYERATDNLQKRLLSLHPWQGDAEALRHLPVPHRAMIAKWKKDLNRALAAQDSLQTQLKQLRLDLSALCDDRHAIAQEGGVATVDAARARSLRERAWAAHRETLNAETADYFEAALRQDDLVTSARFDAAQADAKAQQAARRRDKLLQENEGVEHRLHEAAHDVDAIKSSVEAALTALPSGLVSDDDFTLLEDWLARYSAAIEAAESHTTAAQDWRYAAERAESAQTELRDCFLTIGVACAPSMNAQQMLEYAQSLLDETARLRQLRANVDMRAREREAVCADVKKAELAESQWEEHWKAACAACWIGEDHAAPTPAIVRDLLDLVAELGGLLEKRAELYDRIEKMEQDKVFFIDDVLLLAQELSDESLTLLAKKDPLHCEGLLLARLAKARAAQNESLKIAKALADLRDQKIQHENQKSLHSAQKSDMLDFFKVETLNEVGVRLQEAERRRDLEAQSAEAMQDILTIMQIDDFNEAQTRLDQADRSTLQAELIAVRADLAPRQAHAMELFSAYNIAARRVEEIGGDDVVAKIEQKRRTLLEEIEDGAAHYLRLRFGGAAAERALRVYRDRHRSAMLKNASRAFSAISRNAYASLATQPTKQDEEGLIVLSSDGRSKNADELSKGARLQLYLALRIAGYQEFARLRAPPPFVADDILESFDDFRAEETFKLFAEMGRIGQVIYFTHHRHLCEIAQRAAPSVTIHHLSA